MTKIISNRSELLFMYDIKDGNPNGDPLDDNKPRIDEQTGFNLVTDVRLKRTIRDYFYDIKKKEIFVRQISDKEGYIQDAKLRAEDFLKKASGESLNKKKITISEMIEIIDNNILSECIDVRLFGATIPIERDINDKGSITHTGPVQFKIGRSLHKVYIKHFKGTGAFADKYTDKKKSRQQTFREEDFLLYSFICFYGIINENAAKETKLTEKDVECLLDGIWNGTKNLISRSKVGQVPRLLLKVNYTENNFHIGDLNNLVIIKSDLVDDEIRDISEFKLDISKLITKLNHNKKTIKNIEYFIDKRMKIISNDKEDLLEIHLKNIGIEVMELNLRCQ